MRGSIQQVSIRGLIGFVALLGCLAYGYSALSRDGASQETRSRDFAFLYEVVVREVPESVETAYLWIPVPLSTAD